MRSRMPSLSNSRRVSCTQRSDARAFFAREGTDGQQCPSSLAKSAKASKIRSRLPSNAPLSQMADCNLMLIALLPAKQSRRPVDRDTCSGCQGPDGGNMLLYQKGNLSVESLSP